MHFISARANFSLREWDACIKACDQVLGIDPEFPPGFYCRGFASHELGRLGQALSDFQRVVDLIPSDTKDPTLQEMRYEALRRIRSYK